MAVSDVLDYREVGWGKRVKLLSGGRGVDYVVETSEDGEEVRAAVAVGAQIAVVGGRGANGGNSFDMRVTPAHVRKVFTGSRELFEELIRAIEICDIKPVLDSKIFEYAEAPAAFEYLARLEALRGERLLLKSSDLMHPGKNEGIKPDFSLKFEVEVRATSQLEVPIPISTSNSIDFSFVNERYRKPHQ